MNRTRTLPSTRREFEALVRSLMEISARVLSRHMPKSRRRERKPALAKTA